MSGEIWLPQWKRVDLGGPNGDPYQDTDNVKILWHTWEGTNWDAAESAFAPYPPHIGAKIGDEVHQYVPLDEHAYALLGSRNEREFVIQIEVAGFARDSRFMSYADKEWLARNVLEPILFFHDVADVHPPFYDEQDGFTLASPSSPIRYDFSDWVNFTGHVGHQHAPAPDEHWDPGCLDVDTIIRIARNNGQKAAPTQGDDDVAVGYLCVRSDKPSEVWVAGREVLRPFKIADFDSGHAHAFAAGIKLGTPPDGLARKVSVTLAGKSEDCWEIAPTDAPQFGI